MKLQRVFTVIFILVLGYLIFRGCMVALKVRSDSIFTEGSNSSLPTLDLYTAGTATTPQLALFAGIAHGEVSRLFNIRVHLWKNPDELLVNVLAGKGDLWVGHTEGFAMARKRNAPVQILAFTSYRKFFIIASRGVKGLRDLSNRTVAYSPPGSPAVPLMEAIMNKTQLRIRLEPHEMKELSLLISSGRINTAILPEPLVSVLLSRHGNFSVIGCVEDLFLKETGYRGTLPVAAIAVNVITAGKYRDRIAELQEIIVRQSKNIAVEGEKASVYFPSYLEEYVSRDIVAQSLKRDKPLARYGEETRNDLNAYLRVVHPELFTGSDTFDMDGNFLWK